MNQGRSPDSIATAWREMLDLSLETGEAPVYTIGAPADGLTGQAAVIALALLDAGRKDLTLPLVTAGGVSPLWLAALWHPRAASAPPQTPPTTAAYTAPDITTHLAALTTWDTRRAAYHQRPQQLPPWAQPLAAPETNPAAPEPWQSLPLARFSTHGERDGWLAWAGLVMAVALLLIAVLA
ncbi:MAG TPA: hypothetical protein DCL15_20655 [Chloroflexi bacterium]|nr:hypothetical protein [Chloroflexota bacterium]HHW85544.1 hypothetical protein [Chloroflexota bacterium]